MGYCFLVQLAKSWMMFGLKPFVTMICPALDPSGLSTQISWVIGRWVALVFSRGFHWSFGMAFSFIQCLTAVGGTYQTFASWRYCQGTFLWLYVHFSWNYTCSTVIAMVTWVNLWWIIVTVVWGQHKEKPALSILPWNPLMRFLHVLFSNLQKTRSRIGSDWSSIRAWLNARNPENCGPKTGEDRA